MFLTITDDQSGEILMQRTLSRRETIDCDAHAADFARDYFDAAVSWDGYVPLGCGHFTVELAEAPRSSSCWSARSYFVGEC
jgi:hypothetical protein